MDEYRPLLRRKRLSMGNRGLQHGRTDDGITMLDQVQDVRWMRRCVEVHPCLEMKLGDFPERLEGLTVVGERECPDDNVGTIRPAR